MRILAIDPGTTQSGLAWMEGPRVERAEVLPNTEVLRVLRSLDVEPGRGWQVVVEMIASYGMPVGKETFETVVWIGRFLEATNESGKRLFRRDIKLHLCGSARAKDANIWQAIVDRYGGDAAIGKKATPGPLYGVKSHSRAALALGLAWLDGIRSEGMGA